MTRRFSLLLASLLLLVAACSSSEPAQSTTSSVPPTTLPPTTVAPTTLPPTTTLPPSEVTLADAPPELAGLIHDLYRWLVDDAGVAPTIPSGLREHLGARAVGTPVVRTGTAHTATLPNGDSVAVVSVEGDVVLAVEDDAGWRLVGAALPTLGFAPWYGPSPRLVLILGSDARPGENQLLFRADSIHLVSTVVADSAGAIVGFPRDSWVTSPAGRMKFTNVMANRGPEIMLETMLDLTQLPVEGYIVTGFAGFTGFFEEFGDLTITLERAIRGGIAGWRDYPAGEQVINPADLLRLARIRKTLPAGDFSRSENHGVIMQAALTMAQDRGIEALPGLLEMLMRHAWTDLPTEELLTFGAGLFALEVDSIDNMVLPGSVGTAGSASVVFLGDGAEATYRDLEDGLLDDS